MEKYNPASKCPKCGSEHVMTEYSQVSELMKRQCTNCSYIFFQEPLDKVQP